MITGDYAAPGKRFYLFKKRLYAWYFRKWAVGYAWYSVYDYVDFYWKICLHQRWERKNDISLAKAKL